MKLDKKTVEKNISSFGGTWVGNEYINNTSKLKIQCSTCGKIFLRSYASIKTNKNAMCKKCTCALSSKNHKYIKFKKDVAEVKKYIDSIGGKWISGEYVNSKSKLKLLCPKCGEVFNKTYFSLKRNDNPLCIKCTKKENGKKISKGLSKENLDKIKELGGKLVRVEFGKGRIIITIKCSLCDSEFDIIGKSMLIRRKTMLCYDCSRKFIIDKKRYSIEEVRKYIENLGGKLLSESYNNNSDYLKILCNKCNKEFERTFDVVKQYESVTCPNCKDIISKGEIKIRDILLKNNIDFTMQQKFKGCYKKNYLRFDFYIKEFNTCIEFNGLQHYEPIKFYGGKNKFKKTVERDNIKKQYCKKNNIKLITIPYWNIKKIESILIDNNIIPSQASGETPRRCND